MTYTGFESFIEMIGLKTLINEVNPSQDYIEVYYENHYFASIGKSIRYDLTFFADDVEESPHVSKEAAYHLFSACSNLAITPLEER